MRSLGRFGGTRVVIPYNIVYSGGSDEIVEKKSRFIANVFSVKTEEEAAAIIEETKKKYWDARHNCFAFVLGERGGITRCTDDGEPAGTAGRPILEVLTGANIRNVLVIVTRYFGGTLLGTGGLVRAYSQATQAGLAASKIVAKEHGKKVIIETDYNGIGKLQYIAAQMELTTIDTEYSDKVIMKLLVKEDLCDQFVKKVVEATAGQAVIDDREDIYFAIVDGEPVFPV